MKKMMQATITVAVIFLLGACGKNGETDTTKTDADTLTVTIVLKEDDQEFVKKELTVKKDESVQTIMETNFKVDVDNGMISSIEGHKQDTKANKYWLYEVNEKQPEVGASEYFVKDGDTVTWMLNKL